MPLRGATRKARPHSEDAASADANVVPRKRLSAAERERQILAGAIEFFSRHGLDGQMRVLAQGIGITHALLYHYFPTKQALLDRVYRELFEGRWKPEWETLLDDPRLPIPEKLTRFYCDYATFILSRDFVRIFVFSGLSDHYITDRFFDLLRERLFPRLVRETRKYRGLRSRARPTARELELLMGLHGGIFYTGIRRWIYGQEVHGAEGSDQDRIYIEDRVKAYLVSAATVLNSEAGSLPAATRRISPATRKAKGD
jgi:AcrR family transcriptional regulator